MFSTISSISSTSNARRQRRIADSAHATSHRQVQINRDARNHLAVEPRDARYGPEQGPSLTVYHEDDSNRVWGSRFDEQRNSVIQPLMHGQVTQGHWQQDGYYPHTGFRREPFPLRIPQGYEWDEVAQNWLVPRPMTEPPRVYQRAREEERTEPLNPFAAMFGAGSTTTATPTVHVDDRWTLAVQSYFQEPDGHIGRFRTDGTQLVDWQMPGRITIGSYLVVPPLSLRDLQATLAADVRATCDEQTLLSISNPYFFKVGALTHDASGKWFRLDQAKEHVGRPQEPPIFTSKSVRLSAISSVPMLVLTPTGTSFAFPPAHQGNNISIPNSNTIGRDSVDNVPSGLNPGPLDSRPRQRVVFSEHPKVDPALITSAPSDEDDSSSSISDDDRASDDRCLDPSGVICCETNQDATLVPLNKQHDSAGMKDQLEDSCLARNLCSKDVVLQITDRRLLQFLPAARILKSIKKLGRLTADSDSAVNRYYATIMALPLLKSDEVLLGFYKTFFAINEETPLQLDPEGTMLAYFHPQYKHGGSIDATTFFDSDPLDPDSIQEARDRVMSAIHNLIPVFTYLMWPIWEELMSEVSQLVDGRMIPSYLFPPSYVAHHLHSLLASFGMVARHERTQGRWSANHLCRQFRKLVTRPFADEKQSTMFYSAISQYRLGGTPTASGAGRKSKRDSSSKTGGGGATPQKTKKVRGQPKKAASTSSSTPSTQTVVITPAGANPPPNPPVQPPAPSVATYCRVHLLGALGIVNPTTSTPYACTRGYCNRNNKITHTRVTLHALSTKKEIEDFLATQVSLDTWGDRTVSRVAEVQYQKVVAFAATRP